MKLHSGRRNRVDQSVMIIWSRQCRTIASRVGRNGSLAQAFLLGGVGAFVGTYWPVAADATFAQSKGLSSLPECDQWVLKWWIETFSWSDLRNQGPLSSVVFLPGLFSKRIIKHCFPGISVVELTRDTKPTAWRMTLTKFWECGSSFDRSRLSTAAVNLDDSDRGNLL